MGLAYRSDDEVAYWRTRDPIPRLEQQLAEQDILSTEAAMAVHAEVTREVEAGVRFAEESPLPDPSALLEDVYA